jgi:RNA polymerase sigma factor (sigma-70 family)
VLPFRRAKPEGEGTSLHFRETFEQYYPVVVRQLTVMLGDAAAAEDLAQETFLKLYQSPPEEEGNLLGWLRTVAYRTALNHLRGEKSRRRREERIELERVNVVTLDEVVWRNQEVKAVRQALESLSARDRTALLMRHSGSSYTEIAEAVGLNKTSVGTVLARAQMRFREIYLAEEGQ